MINFSKQTHEYVFFNAELKIIYQQFLTIFANFMNTFLIFLKLK